MRWRFDGRPAREGRADLPEPALLADLPGALPEGLAAGLLEALPAALEAGLAGLADLAGFLLWAMGFLRLGEKGRCRNRLWLRIGGLTGWMVSVLFDDAQPIGGNSFQRGDADVRCFERENG